MLSVRFLLLLSAAIVLAASADAKAWSLTGSKTLKDGERLVSENVLGNFVDVMTLKVSHSKDIQICIQYETEMPHIFNADSCTFFKGTAPSPPPPSTTGNTTGSLSFEVQEAGTETSTEWSFPVRAIDFQIGIMKKDNDAKEEDKISFTATGKVCPLGEIADGNDCEKVTPVPANGVVASTDFQVGEKKFFSVSVGNLVGALTLTTSKQGSFRMADGVQFTIRHEASPSDLYHDEQATDSLSYAGPLAGKYYIVVKALQAGIYGWETDAKACPEGFGGMACADSYESNMLANMSVPLQQGQYSFFSVVVDPNVSSVMNISVGVSDAKNDPFPKVYISRGQLPSASRHYLGGCNAESCVINIFNHNLTDLGSDNVTYYVAVTTDAVNGTNFGIWFGGSCAPDCILHGTCEEDTQVCRCVSTWVGLDCATEGTGLGPQYIVLIIIASLVVASAIIGFFAWAYMKKKKNNYRQI